MHQGALIQFEVAFVIEIFLVNRDRRSYQQGTWETRATRKLALNDGKSRTKISGYYVTVRLCSPIRD